MPDPQGPHPLDSLAEELIHKVRDEPLRRWRGWLRGQNEMGHDIPNLRRKFEACGFNEQQVEFIWRLLFEAADYQMHMLMAFVDDAADNGRLKIDVYSKPVFSEEGEIVNDQELEYEIHFGEMFPGWYCGWSEKYGGGVSIDWKVEKLREPDRKH